MSLAAILEVLVAFFKFPDSVYKFVKLLQKTPQENHDALLKAAEDETIKFEQTGRPTWTK